MTGRGSRGDCVRPASDADEDQAKYGSVEPLLRLIFRGVNAQLLHNLKHCATPLVWAGTIPRAAARGGSVNACPYEENGSVRISAVTTSEGVQYLLRP